jgi:signal peptidase I
LLISFAALLVGFWPLRLLSFYAGFCVLYCAWIVLCLYAACNAFLAKELPTSSRSSRWWLVAVLPGAVLILSLTGALVTRGTGFRSFSIPSTSMERTIERGDHIIVDTHCYRSEQPERRDVIVFKQDGTFFIKRVIAVGGDIVEGKPEIILVNGSTQTEPYVRHMGQPDWINTFGPDREPQPPDWLNAFGPIRVPAGNTS